MKEVLAILRFPTCTKQFGWKVYDIVCSSIRTFVPMVLRGVGVFGGGGDYVVNITIREGSSAVGGSVLVSHTTTCTGTDDEPMRIYLPCVSLAADATYTIVSDMSKSGGLKECWFATGGGEPSASASAGLIFDVCNTSDGTSRTTVQMGQIPIIIVEVDDVPPASCCAVM